MKGFEAYSMLTVSSDGHASLVETSESKRRNMPDRSVNNVIEFASL